MEAHLGGADGITVHLREDRRHIQDEDVRRLRELTHIKLNLEMAARPTRWSPSRAGIKPEMAMLVSRGPPGSDHRRRPRHRGPGEARSRARWRSSPDAGIMTSVFIDAELAQVEAAARIGARVCEIHTGPYAHAFHSKGRDAETQRRCVAELEKIRKAGEAIRGSACASTPGHALNYVERGAGRGACRASASCTSATRS